MQSKEALAKQAALLQGLDAGTQASRSGCCNCMVVVVL
jgi:hypothetical protein